MDTALPTFQTLLEPYQQLVAFKLNLQQTRLCLAQLEAATPSFLPQANEWVTMATSLLNHIDPHIQRLEHQLLVILQLQLHHFHVHHGHLPVLEEAD